MSGTFAVRNGPQVEPGGDCANYLILQIDNLAVVGHQQVPVIVFLPLGGVALLAPGNLFVLRVPKHQVRDVQLLGQLGCLLDRAVVLLVGLDLSRSS